MGKGHLEIVCKTKFHMPVCKTKFYAVKCACANAIFILLILELMLLHLLGFLLTPVFHEDDYPEEDGTLHMGCDH